MRCSVYNCASREGQEWDPFFLFPRGRILQKQWLEFCGRRPNEINVRSAKVCAKHFKPEQFVLNWKGRITGLKARVVPCIYNANQTLMPNMQVGVQPPAPTSNELFAMYGPMAMNFMRAMHASNGGYWHKDTYNLCVMHNNTFRYVCEYCKQLICDICLRQLHSKHAYMPIKDFVAKSKNVLQVLLESSRLGITLLEKSVNNEFGYTHIIDENLNDLTYNIRSLFRPLITALEERERFLLDLVQRLHQHRMNTLYEQMTAIKAAYFSLIDTAQMLHKIMQNYYSMNEITIASRIIQGQQRIDESAQTYRNNQPQEELYKFFAPQFPNNLWQSIQQIGSVQLVGNEGTGANQNQPSQASDIFSLLFEKSQKRRTREMDTDVGDGGDAELVFDNSAKKSRTETTSTARTVATVSTIATAPTVSTVATVSTAPTVAIAPIVATASTVAIAAAAGTVNRGIGQAVSGWMERVKALRCDIPTLAFATKGTSGDGYLNRPWGICVNKSGHIFVTDRRMNNVQVFAGTDGRFLYSFGAKGSANGEFDSPVGICTDKSGRVMVADKNNHRIQVFSSGGKFLLTFGGLGSGNGQLKFPFDVAVNTQLQIAVADVANNRIQLFEHNGRFLKQIDLGVCSATGLQVTPRGICYTPTGRIIVTDYSNHCLHLIDLENCKIVKTRGSQGSGLLQFNCPSGICCDDEGTIIVADAHNQRIKVFSSTLEEQWSLDVRPSVNCLKMSYFNETDRTCDVALTREGRIVFVTELLPAKEAEAKDKRFVHIY